MFIHQLKDLSKHLVTTTGNEVCTYNNLASKVSKASYESQAAVQL